MSKVAWRAGNMLYPVPAVMVSCMDKEGKPNIITIAWAGTVCSDPAMVSISVRKSRYSHKLISESGEFVVNLVSKRLTKACDFCGVRSGKDLDKFKEMGLNTYVSEFMNTPSIAESPVNIYCKVVKTLELGSHDMFIGEVVGVTIEDKYLDDKNKFHLDKTNLITYSHGEYFLLGEKLGTFGYSVKKKKNDKGSKKGKNVVKYKTKKNKKK